MNAVDQDLEVNRIRMEDRWAKIKMQKKVKKAGIKTEIKEEPLDEPSAAVPGPSGTSSKAGETLVDSSKSSSQASAVVKEEDEKKPAAVGSKLAGLVAKANNGDGKSILQQHDESICCVKPVSNSYRC